MGWAEGAFGVQSRGTRAPPPRRDDQPRVATIHPPGCSERHCASHTPGPMRYELNLHSSRLRPFLEPEPSWSRCSANRSRFLVNPPHPFLSFSTPPARRRSSVVLVEAATNQPSSGSRSRRGEGEKGMNGRKRGEEGREKPFFPSSSNRFLTAHKHQQHTTRSFRPPPPNHVLTPSTPTSEGEQRERFSRPLGSSLIPALARTCACVSETREERKPLAAQARLSRIGSQQESARFSEEKESRGRE